MLPRVSGTKTRRHLLWRRWWACARRSRMNEHCTCTSKKYTERIGTLCELEFHWYWSSHFHLNIQTSASMANPSSSKIALAPSWAWGRVHPVHATDCQATLCLEFSKNQRKSQSHMSKVIQSHLYTVTVMPLSTLDTNHKKITCSGQTHKKETQQTSNSWYMNHRQATVCSLQNGLGWAKRRSLTTLRRVRSVHPVPKQGMISTTQKKKSHIITSKYSKSKWFWQRCVPCSGIWSKVKTHQSWKSADASNTGYTVWAWACQSNGIPYESFLTGFACYNATILSSCLDAKKFEKNVNLLKHLKISVF